MAYWLARDIQHLLGYAEWRNFGQVISKAKTACEVSGQLVKDHFVDVNKMVLDQLPTHFAGCFGFADDLAEVSPLGVTQQMLYVPCQPVRHATFGLLRMALKGVGEGVDPLFFHGEAPYLTSFSMASN